ncbi:MAG: radical SAM protein [Candidatus Bathyarchaeia archaeon]
MMIGKVGSLLIRSLTPNKPHHVQWMITRKCNYHCRGCNVWQEQDSKELPTEEIKRGLDILKELGIIEIVISGGNPLLREDAGEIIKYSSRYFITTVYDNGSMAAEKIDALRSADFVAISVDSLDPRKNDYIKGVKGAWEKAMRSVERLHEEGIRVAVTPTISQFNLHEILDLTNYFLNKGIPVWYCLYSYDAPDDPCHLFKIGKKNDEFLITDGKAMVMLCDSLMEMKKRNSNILMTTQTLEAIRNLYLRGKRTWRCRALRDFFILDHMGRISGCHAHKPIASVFDLPKLWNSEKFNELRKIYGACTQCTYLCYIFYSIHGGVLGNLEVAQDRWKSAKLFLRNNFKSPNLVKKQ